MEENKCVIHLMVSGQSSRMDAQTSEGLHTWHQLNLAFKSSKLSFTDVHYIYFDLNVVPK